MLKLKLAQETGMAEFLLHGSFNYCTYCNQALINLKMTEELKHCLKIEPHHTDGERLHLVRPSLTLNQEKM